MCGRYRDLRTWAEHREMMASVGLTIAAPSAVPNLQPVEEVRPTDTATIFRSVKGGVELARLRWWLVPFFHRGSLKEWKLTTFNARAESIKTASTFKESFNKRRCLVSASGWYEWTGPKGNRTMWLIEPRDEPIYFAGLWDRCNTADAGTLESFTIIVQPAGAPLNAYHDRAPVTLFGEECREWLTPSANIDALLHSESRDRFKISRYITPS